MSKLVIVESPAKAKTIKKYLGSGYEVVASMGHIRDLPQSKIGIDIENDFAPQYVNIRGKADLIKSLKNAAAQSDAVFLATDPDREGEAISWHLANILALNLDDENRITFNEITKQSVAEGIKNPRKINIDLVDAQQARRVLDRLVGYKISPFLWKSVKSGLSGGRVQSVATRIIVDREAEIRAFVPQEYWTIDVTLARMGKPGSFIARYYGDSKKKELESQDPQRTAKPVAVSDPDDQVSLMDLSAQQVSDALRAIHVETLTPIEAMNELYKLKKLLE